MPLNKRVERAFMVATAASTVAPTTNDPDGGRMSVALDLHPGKTLPKPISWKFGPAIPEVKCVSLALQGGGAHGAFTWGVLDRLLEEPCIEVEGVSATSAGAMNAAVMAHGLTPGGERAHARRSKNFGTASR